MEQRITVVAATSFRINEHAIAIDRTASVMPFPVRRLLLASKRPTARFSGEWHNIPEWMPAGQWTVQDYSRFIIKGLANYVTTNFALIVQWDGYGLNGVNWQPEFIKYDYIGAPWPTWPDIKGNHRVGNGGFSLRSKLWLQAEKSAPQHAGEPEDFYCCQKYVEHYLGLRLKITDTAGGRRSYW